MPTSENYSAITTGEVDADSPLDASLLGKIRAAIINLHERLGGSYDATIENHNHDGVNSALIEIGPNFVRNGSFESGTSGWTITQYTGGTVATNTANDMDGATALAFTSTSVANGGGDATSAGFMPVSGGRSYRASCMVKAGASNVSSKLEVIWYSDAQAQISATTVCSETSTPTTASIRGGTVVAPSNARYAKLKFTGCVPGVGSSTGTVYVDGIVLTFGAPPVEAGTAVLVDAGDATATTSASFVKVKEVAIHVEGRVRVTFDVAQTLGSQGDGQVYINGSPIGAVHVNNGTVPSVSASDDVSVTVGDLVQVYARRTSGSGDIAIKNMQIKTAVQMLPYVAL